VFKSLARNCWWVSSRLFRSSVALQLSSEKKNYFERMKISFKLPAIPWWAWLHDPKLQSPKCPILTYMQFVLCTVIQSAIKI
jgi:hypothetical protein